MSAQAFCPACRNDLVSCPITTCTDTDLVRYECGNCATRSEWLFDAPVPLLISPRVLGPLANRETETGRSLWSAVVRAAQTVSKWPLWKRGQR